MSKTNARRARGGVAATLMLLLGCTVMMGAAPIERPAAPPVTSIPAQANVCPAPRPMPPPPPKDEKKRWRCVCGDDPSVECWVNPYQSNGCGGPCKIKKDSYCCDWKKVDRGS